MKKKIMTFGATIALALMGIGGYSAFADPSEDQSGHNHAMPSVEDLGVGAKGEPYHGYWVATEKSGNQRNETTYEYEGKTISTCSEELHKRYAVHGKDGALYDSWHPTVVKDPSTGELCSFGHEHGDDPKTSDIYEFAAAHFSLNSEGIPFGVVNQASAEYSESTGSIGHRHEDHVGHKVFVANNVKLVKEDRSGYVKDEKGNVVECDYLIQQHQGTHSPDATQANTHETEYAAVCTDGTEVALQGFTRFGAPNEFTEKCSGETIDTSVNSMDLESQSTGRRVIPTVECVTANEGNSANSLPDVWSLYEIWEADNTYQMPDGGSIYFDPWYGVRNPSRVADVDNGETKKKSTIDLAESVKVPYTTNFWWRKALSVLSDNDDAVAAKESVESPFNGAARDLYLAHTKVTIGSSYPENGVWYTDPYGEHASVNSTTKGMLEQYVANHSTQWDEMERWSSGFSTNYGAKGSGVHSKN
ncbi:MAG: hypothetical protein J6M18_03825, partial [Actinomycetaceae bacterium]|nr:hypothetical protein [Actinomycetaceae bacterium]